MNILLVVLNYQRNIEEKNPFQKNIRFNLKSILVLIIGKLESMDFSLLKKNITNLSDSELLDYTKILSRILKCISS